MARETHEVKIVKDKIILLPAVLVLTLAILFVADMLLNRGAVVAHKTLEWSPNCGNMCH